MVKQLYFDDALNIIEASELYSPSTHEWTKENPLFIIGVLWYDESAEEHQYTSLGTFKIDGIASYDEIDNQLKNNKLEGKSEFDAQWAALESIKENVDINFKEVSAYE